MTRSISAVAVLLSLLAAGDGLARGRAVRSATHCSYGLVPSFSTTTILAEGLSHGAITVTGVRLPDATLQCTSWSAFSSASWVTVSRTGNNTASVDVAPNPTSLARSATLLIAGVRLDIHQDAAAVISPPTDPNNVVKNPGFNSDLSFWEWQSRFPNGPGSASWAAPDAKGNAASGSIRLVNTRPADQGHTFQQLQCVAVDAGEIYEYGGSFLATSTTAVSAVFAIVEYEDEGCDVKAVSNEAQTPRSKAAGSWQTETYTKRMGPATKSAFVVIGNLARVAGTYELWIDDVFLRRR